MTPRRVVPLTLLVTLALSAGTPAQQSQAPGRVVSSGTRAVLVDVVVRDRLGQPVPDLRASDFELLEDGVPQSIVSFSATFGGAGAEAGSAPAKAPSTTAEPAAGAPKRLEPGPGVTALVFDRMPAESRRIAAQAARSYLGTQAQTSDFIAVYGIDLSLSVFVPFTRNGVALSQALDTMLRRGALSPAARDMLVSTANPPPVAPAGNSAADILNRMQTDMQKDFDEMDRQQQGYAATNGLFSIVQTLGRIPGRKSLVFFSEGVPTPDQVHSFYLGVIDAANRANVSIYTMDAAGLRVNSDQARVRDAVNGAALGIATGYSVDGVSDSYLGRLEANSASLRSDPRYSLGVLADATGGLFFNNTNNLRPAFDRIRSDLRNYYLLGYTPSNGNYDGAFRKVEVRFKRPGVTIASRRGYFAVRDPGGAPINDWESGALGALEQQPVGNAFPVRAGAMHFPEPGRPGLVPVVVRVQTAPLSFVPAADGTSYTSNFTILVRFVDQADPQPRVVRRLSQHYEIRGPLAEMERARNGDVIFYRDSELPPGLYAMETVVFDAPTGKSSVRFSTIEVPRRAESTLRTSSLVLVRSSEKAAPKDRNPRNPLVVNELLLTPNLGEPVRKSKKELGFYFAVYPAAGGPAPESTIELYQNGVRVARMPMQIATPDAYGRIQQLGRLPIADLTPGTYELHAVVAQGDARIVRSSLVNVIE